VHREFNISLKEKIEKRSVSNEIMTKKIFSQREICFIDGKSYVKQISPTKMM
jgi:hypothetical protein